MSASNVHLARLLEPAASAATLDAAFHAAIPASQEIRLESVYQSQFLTFSALGQIRH